MPDMSTHSRRAGPILSLAHEVRAAIDGRDAAVESSMGRCAAAPGSRERAMEFLRITQNGDMIYEAAVHHALDRYRRTMSDEDA
jgi:hypothetical protein